MSERYKKKHFRQLVFLHFVVRVCDGIPDLSNGSRNPNTESVTCGSKVTYSCNKGFKLMGNSELECKADGMLHGQIPACNISGDFKLINLATYPGNL